jgi:hypothetical protein
VVKAGFAGDEQPKCYFPSWYCVDRLLPLKRFFLLKIEIILEMLFDDIHII